MQWDSSLGCWVEAPTAEEPPEAAPRVFAKPLDLRARPIDVAPTLDARGAKKRQREEADEAEAAAAAAPRQRRAAAAAAAVALQAKLAEDLQVGEDIKEQEKERWIAAGGEAGALDDEHAESDLEIDADWHSDDKSYGAPSRGRKAKRPRTDKKPNIADKKPKIATLPAAADETASTDDASDLAPAAAPPAPSAPAASPSLTREGDAEDCPIVLD